MSTFYTIRHITSGVLQGTFTLSGSTKERRKQLRDRKRKCKSHSVIIAKNWPNCANARECES